MSDSIDLDEVIALLFDERRYSGDMRPKALHKILYFAESELSRERVDVDIDTFWYMWGAVVSTADAAIDIQDGTDGQRVVCRTTISEIDAPEPTIRRTRRAVSRALERYYDLGIEGLTDEMYAEAPYVAQRHYRELDKQLDAASDREQMTLTLDRNEKRTRETLHRFVRSFPLDDFPEYHDDLHIWYRLMSAELDAEDYDPDDADKLAKTFWRLFCLELACRQDALTREEVAMELDLESIEDAKEEMRVKLRRQEQKKARRNSRDGETVTKAADAFATPFLAEDIVNLS